MKVLKIKEHKKFELKEDRETLQSLSLDFSCEKQEVKFLKLDPNFETSYFIGLDWLIPNQCALMVYPKIENLDYLQMFMTCFNNPEICEDLKKIYKIKFGEPPINLETNPFELTPLIVFHFLNVVKDIVKKGLKKDYIRIEDNLQSKVKGKIVFSKSLKLNNFKGRTDRSYCNYQEYSVDCFENRLLKKALVFVRLYLNKHFKQNTELLYTLNYVFSAFADVSDEIDYYKIKNLKINALYKEYGEGLRLAQMVLKKFSYSLTETNEKESKEIPPFYIDMSLLFELYVYSKLKQEFGNQISYQSKGKYGNTDFLKIDEKLIIDSKYKPKYTEKDFYDIENIRQLSGYARDKGIAKKLKIENTTTIVDCVIIYPNNDSKIDFNGRSLKEEEIHQFIQFHKCGIKLPLKK